MQAYLIAFGKKPLPGFIESLRKISANDGVEILAMRLVPGQGCVNLGLLLPEPNKQYIETLTMILQPAKYEESTQEACQLVEGEFVREGV
jgi:hypothetical protein